MSYNTQHYNLDAIISVGYRVNSLRARQFRQWATGILRDFAIKATCLTASAWRMAGLRNKSHESDRQPVPTVGFDR